jgi:hypothetical protein
MRQCPRATFSFGSSLGFSPLCDPSSFLRTPLGAHRANAGSSRKFASKRVMWNIWPRQNGTAACVPKGFVQVPAREARFADADPAGFARKLLEDAEGNVDAARGIVDAVRERVGPRKWSPSRRIVRCDPAAASIKAKRIFWSSRGKASFAHLATIRQQTRASATVDGEAPSPSPRPCQPSGKQCGSVWRYTDCRAKRC